jgi:hypothetical protein
MSNKTLNFHEKFILLLRVVKPYAPMMLKRVIVNKKYCSYGLGTENTEPSKNSAKNDIILIGSSVLRLNNK